MFHVDLVVQGRLQIALGWFMCNISRRWRLLCLGHHVVRFLMEAFDMKNLRIVIGLSARIMRWPL